MKFSKEERFEIGKKIYDGAMTRYEAAAAYGIGDDTARDYMRMCRDENVLAPKRGGRSSGNYVCSPRRGDVKPKPGLGSFGLRGHDEGRTYTRAHQGAY